MQWELVFLMIKQDTNNNTDADTGLPAGPVKI
jgi:hypothetical protein